MGIRKVLVRLFVAGSFVVNVFALERHIWPDPRDFVVRYAAGAVAEAHDDPYDSNVLLRATKRIEGDTYIEQGTFGFLDPPPMAAFFRFVAKFPLRATVYAWFVLSVAASAIVAWCSALLVERRPLTVSGWATLGAVGIAFGPARYGVGGLQLDVVLGAVALVATVGATRRALPALVGVGAVLASLKPQVAALPMGSVAVRQRARVVASLGTVVVFAVFAAVAAPSVTWVHWWEKLSDGIAGSIAERAVLAVMAAVGVALWAPTRAAVRRDPLVGFAAAATIGINVFAVVHLNPFSAILLAVPLAIAVSYAVDADLVTQLLTAVPVGILAGGAVQPLTANGGVHAAALPLLAAGLLAVAGVCVRADLTIPIVVAFALNVTLVLGQLTQTGTRIATAIASLFLAFLVTQTTRTVPAR